MSKASLNHRIARALLGATLSAMVLTMTASMSIAASDVDEEGEEVPADVKFFRNIMAGLGWYRDGTGIDYRERSPLVVPPSVTLPPPEPANLAARNPAWPKDPDVQRAKKLRAERKKPQKPIEEQSLPETPAELNKPGPAIARTTQRPTVNNNDPTAPSTAAQLGAKNIFTLDALLGRNKDEYSTFVSEPPRVTLVDPPPGYRTPSPVQPYGVGKQKWTPNAINPTDTPQMRGQDQ